MNKRCGNAALVTWFAAQSSRWQGYWSSTELCCQLVDVLLSLTSVGSRSPSLKLRIVAHLAAVLSKTSFNSPDATRCLHYFDGR